MISGCSYFSNANMFPAIYKKIYQQIGPKQVRRNTAAVDEKDLNMVSHDELLQRKKLKIDDINYNTQDRDFNHQNSLYHTLGNDLENRPSNAMQTQTLIMPYSEQANPQTIQHQDEGLSSNRRASNHVRSSRQENDDVDHRFSSEEDQVNEKESDQEELKVRITQQMIVNRRCRLTNPLPISLTGPCRN
jgi:hypothetical protein